MSQAAKKLKNRRKPAFGNAYSRIADFKPYENIISLFFLFENIYGYFSFPGEFYGIARKICYNLTEPYGISVEIFRQDSSNLPGKFKPFYYRFGVLIWV